MLNTATAAARSAYPGSFNINNYRYSPGHPPTLGVSVFSVGRVAIEADSIVDANGKIHHWQTLMFYDTKGAFLGSVYVDLASPDVAIPCGEMPPYFGAETATVDELGESPF